MSPEESPLNGMNIAEEHLKEMNGRKFPLRLVPGGPVVAEGLLTYHEEEGELRVSYQSDDPNIAEDLKTRPRVIFKKGS